MDIRLNASKLGTQEYWNQFYRREIENFSHDRSDTGENWFDDSDAETKMVQYLVSQIEEGLLAENLSFVDLGTGNGHLLFSLLEELDEEFPEGTFEFTGVDYSPELVEFAREVAMEKHPGATFSFQKVDLLDPNSEFLAENHYKVLLDKGTLDAIALNQDPLEAFDGQIGMDVYAQQVLKLMDDDSILLITSCNFTEEELTKIITRNGTLVAFDRINFPSFEFGGQKGSTICSIAFRKRL